MSSLPVFPMLGKETKKKMVGSPKYKWNYTTSSNNKKEWKQYRKSREHGHVRKSFKQSYNA